MTDTSVQISAGTGTRLRTESRSIGGQTVHSEFAQIDEATGASYTVRNTSTISTATASSHLIQIMAGASLRVYLKRLRVFQSVLATTATTASFTLVRLTTAGTGGTALTPVALDPADGAAGATGMTLPTANGTEAGVLYTFTGTYIQTLSATFQLQPIVNLDFTQLGLKCPIIAAGVTNGLALKQITAVAGATVFVDAEIVEWSF